ncbi:hypothetical protein GCM10010869_51790 [Mesorhizobium tianshanense]|uniref:hypothetical protein n=1 Tax=Mesorhizobium tianshanense TaxID=39844 RepID=UPI001F0B3DBB|nr:hypothetical protein [Mesorhizobium tianshanense]GLS39582.1 hypothetical protein GCM10010869_51790 [Mesorhizobium tianshanense]
MRSGRLTNLFSPLQAGSAIKGIENYNLRDWKKPLVENSKDTARARADLRFKKQEEAATVRQKAMAEYVAESDARQIKTNKLRALRLAKEAEDLANAPAVPAKKPARAKKK